MDFLVNDRSLHGQFADVASFRKSLSNIMAMRALIGKASYQLYSHRNLVQSRIGPELGFQQGVLSLPQAERGAILSWITKHGPFWEDLREHGSDDWLEVRGDIVTDTALGEAAFLQLHGTERPLVSFAPSEFNHDPIAVDWVRADQERKQAHIRNFWDPAALQRFLESSPRPVLSWADLENLARQRFDVLTIAGNAFAPLAGQPFSKSAAERILVLLQVLHRLRGCHDENGNRTPEGHELYQNFFTGKKGDGGSGARFSDSSESEKHEFEAELTFPNPDIDGTTIFCPWHGKVQTPPLRIHFSHPIRASEPLYVVYVGPKITKR